MRISCIMSISKILTDLCALRQILRIKITFENIVYNVLLMEMSCKNIKRYV